MLAYGNSNNRTSCAAAADPGLDYANLGPGVSDISQLRSRSPGLGPAADDSDLNSHRGRPSGDQAESERDGALHHEAARREPRLDPDAPWPWLVDHHRPNICSEVRRKRWRKDEEDQAARTFRINIAELQRMRLVQLQCRVAKHALAMCQSEQEPENWSKDVHDYGELASQCLCRSKTTRQDTFTNLFSVEAIQEYDYMGKWSNLVRDPFVITGERKLDRLVIRRVMLKLGGDLNNARDVEPIGPWEEKYIPIADTRSGSFSARWFERFSSRLLMGLVSGAFLLAPMWIMVLRSDTFIKLGVTTASVAAFATVMTFSLQETQDVVSATAAYAAVLMVFVGASTPTTSVA